MRKWYIELHFGLKNLRECSSLATID